jgi:glutathione peroxidase
MSKNKKGKLKKLLIVTGMVILVFIGYVEIINRNSTNMTYRQKFLKAVYPALMWIGGVTGKRSVKMENASTAPATSIYNLSITLNNGSELKLETLKGKKILLVNTASNCGYTGQYADLQKLYDANKEKLMIIGFPANDFKEQEKGTDQEIAEFCKVNYGVSFPLAKKSTVIGGNEQNPVFKWLSDKSLNGWNDQEPTWNFSKYLVNEQGMLTNYFDPGISPTAVEIKKAVKL